MQYLKKGSRAYVEGRLEARPWTDQQGQVRPGLEVLADEVQFMSNRAGDERAGESSASVADERRRPMPEAMAANGRRVSGGTATVADPHDEPEDLPF